MPRAPRKRRTGSAKSAKQPRRPALPDLDGILQGEAEARRALAETRHDDPHRWLGPHSGKILQGQDEDHGEIEGWVVRVYEPEAESMELVLLGEGTNPDVTTRALGEGFFAAWVVGDAETAPEYRLRFGFPDGTTWQRDDAYRFGPTVGDLDLHLLGEGNHQRLWQCLGARPMTHQGVEGFAFSVWAPNAQRVSVVGEFCRWDGRRYPMRRLGGSGVFDLFVPGLKSGETYKFEIRGSHGGTHLKADPLGNWAEVAPATASRTFRSTYTWGDQDWQRSRAQVDPTRSPMAIYEVHLGSWLRRGDTGPDGEVVEKRHDDDHLLSYRELAPRLIAHAKKLGFDTLELLPVAEHPYDGSWGYQVTGYFAPTARYGDPDDFRHFVDQCHQNGLAVLIDWVPAHFVKDAHGLGRFDGTALYEHQDPRRGEHPDWGTYIFNYGRWEVRNFLEASALYWLDELHVDGLRVDAVASMLYLDYSREEGQWLPNRHGGRENLEAISLLQRVNAAVHERYPGRFTVAEESTAWPGITKPVSEGGLGFDLKWNMGWMHDTLSYFAADPLFRSGCHDQLTFAMVYEYSERFLNPLSHDEVVHGKGSLYGKMPGDPWRKLANLRTLFAYQWTRPGKKLLFMGSELAPQREWNHEQSLDWYLIGDPGRQGLFRFFQDLGKLYQGHRCLWEMDPDPEGFHWIACHDRLASVVAYERRSGRLPSPTPASPEELPAREGDPIDFATDVPRYEHRLVVVLNLTPVPREDYRLGILEPGVYRTVLHSDAEEYGGSGYSVAESFTSEPVPHDGCHHSLVLTLPPLAALVLEPQAVTTGET